jgi:N-methylhydantoinase A/oxoprolinase/acetone carboxylase beta subunit
MDKLPSTLYLGIDTGGTYTDGVLLDPQTSQVVRAKKVLTTHYDLKICIAQILDQLLADGLPAISLVSLSTTLATNAIAEGKRKPVALLLLGYDRELVYQYNFHKQFGTTAYFFIGGRYNLDGVEEIALNEEEIVRVANQIKSEVDAFAVSSYAGPINTQHEERAAEILSGLTRLPIIQAHHLSSELDSIRRATTVSLNASLLSDIQEFLEAVEDMLAQKGLHCPVMIVRGDGSIVKASFARQRPVEIVHSGPATSALGGQFLADASSALVVDMGGTTTDLCLVERGEIQAMQNAATIGPYRTCVRTIKACSFGLGGDSLIHFDHHRMLTIGPERVLPISHFCDEYPEMQRDLALWLRSKDQLYFSDGIEYWVLRREPKREIPHVPTQKAVTLLRSGPRRMRELIEEVGVKSPLLINVDELVNQGIIERVGLTPTDLLHVTGEFSPWNAQIAQLLVTAVAKIWNEDALAFTRRVKDWMTRRITAEIIQYLSHKTLSKRTYSIRGDDLDRWFYEESLNGSDPYLGCKISLKVPLVGIGAPAGIFLPAVAQALGTDCILPKHYEVANAVGTVVGNVIIREEGSVFPCVEGSAITGYFARVVNRQEKFQQYEQALAFARETLAWQVSAEAVAAGAGAVMVECEVKEIVQGMAHLLAWAVSKPGMNGMRPNTLESKILAHIG